MKNKIFNIVSILLGLFMLNGGLNNLFHYMPLPAAPDGATDFMNAVEKSGWLIYLIAGSEIIGGLLFITKRFRALGTLVLLPVITGIVLFHAVQDPANVLITIIMFGVLVWSIYEYREKYLPMIENR